MITQAWLRDNVGIPSNAWGSTYSEIYRITGAHERAPNLAKLERLIELVNKFTWSLHVGTKNAAQRNEKARQALALNQFCAGIKRARAELHNQLNLGPIGNYQPAALADAAASGYPLQKYLIESAIKEMQRDSNALLRNTGLGLVGLRIEIVPHGSNMGSITNNTITVNPVVVHNKLELMGVLVHEYHHFLCRYNREGDTIYVDEFVAHHKQYSITLPEMTAVERVEFVNNRLNDLYTPQVQRWTAHHELITNIAQAGTFQIADNAQIQLNAAHAATPRQAPGLVQ